MTRHVACGAARAAIRRQWFDGQTAPFADEPSPSPRQERAGWVLVFLSALMWTLGGPIGEVPSARTVAGGAVVFTALIVHIGMELGRPSRPARPGVTGVPAPN